MPFSDNLDTLVQGLLQVGSYITSAIGLVGVIIKIGEQFIQPFFIFVYYLFSNSVHSQTKQIQFLQTIKSMIFKQYMHSNIFFILIFTLTSVNAIYDIPSYYGHFSKKFFLPSEILKGTFTYFEYHYAIDIDYNNTYLYYANKDLNCIQRYNLLTNTLSTIGGQCGVGGDRIGNIELMLLNGPESVVYYHPNSDSYQSQKQMQIKIVYNQNCDIDDSNCIVPSSNYDSLTIGIQNLRAHPQINLFPSIDPEGDQYLYVSDTNNHCIKKIDLHLQTSSVVAGSCGSSGFMDGPLGINRLNRPTNLGITRKGVLYFYDEGNQYFRKISQNEQVVTLLNGACKQYGKSREVQGYQIYRVLCYDDWVEYETKADVQHYLDSSTLNICLEHSSKC